MDNEYNTPSIEKDESHSDDGNGSEVANIAEVLGETLGRKFGNDEEALKAVKETQDMVGGADKMKNIILGLKSRTGKTEDEVIGLINQKFSDNPTPNNSDFVSRLELEDRDFLSARPDLKPYTSVIKAMAKSEGKKIQEVVNSETFKPFLDKVLAHDETEKSYSVIHSNPRTIAAGNKMQEAKEITKKNTVRNEGGKIVGMANAEETQRAIDMASQAVIDSLDV